MSMCVVTQCDDVGDVVSRPQFFTTIWNKYYVLVLFHDHKSDGKLFTSVCSKTSFPFIWYVTFILIRRRL